MAGNEGHPVIEKVDNDTIVKAAMLKQDLTATEDERLDPAWRRAIVIEYLKTFSGERINLAEIDRANGWGQTATTKIVRSLIKEGRVTTKRSGKGTVYMWHDTPVPPEQRSALRTMKRTKGINRRMDEEIVASKQVERMEAINQEARRQREMEEEMFHARVRDLIGEFLLDEDHASMERETLKTMKRFTDYVDGKLK